MDECDGTCPVCIQTRRMVSAVIASSLNDIITYLGQEDLGSAQSHAAAFLAILNEVPHSTSDLIGPDRIAGLREALDIGLSGIKNGEADAAGFAFQTGLNAWYQTYPPYQA